MKKNLRYGLIAVLILALLVVTGLVASAAGEVKVLDDTETQVGAFDTLADAAAAADTDGYIISITADLADQAAAELNCDGGTITIRGNDHTVAFAADAGITVGAGTTLVMENVTLTTTDVHATGLTMATDSYDLTLDGVTFTGFGTGVAVDTMSYMDFTDVTIDAVSVGINLMPTSVGGELTLTDCTIRITDEVGAVDEACVLCNGADIIVESGYYRSPRNTSAGQQAAFLWNDGGSGSHLTINGGEFRRWNNACVLFMCKGDGSTLPNFGGDAWITINDGYFRAVSNNPMFRCNALPIKGDDDAETCVDLVINGGEFIGSTTGLGNEAMFQLYGPFRLTINDGNFEVRHCMMLVFAANTRKEAGHENDPVVSNIYGGTFACSSLLQCPSSASYVSVVNFGAPGEPGPQFTVRNHRMNNQTSRGNFFFQNGSAAHCVINFYSGTFDILDEKGLDQNGEPTDDCTTKHFIHGAGAGINFYGGTFNYDAAGHFLRLADCDQYSVVNFLKNPGENGVTINMGPKAQRFFVVSSAGSDHNDYNLDVGHMQGEDPARYAEHGAKVIITMAYGTFNNGRGWIDVTGSGFELNIGAPDTDGPTFTVDEPNDYGYGFIHFSNACSTLYNTNRTNVLGHSGESIPRNTLTVGTINIYSGTFDIQGDVEALFNNHGGKLHIEGGDFTVKTASMFQFRDQDKIGELEIEGGTFTLTGSGQIINYTANYSVGNNYKGAITLTGGTFAATGTATGALFSLTSPNKLDNVANEGTATFTLGTDVVINKVATARYFDIGANMRGDIVLNDRVFPQDPTAGLGGYRATPAVGGYQAVLTPANKVFYGSTMSLTDQYQLTTYWKVTEAEAAAFTKVVMTGISHFSETVEITEATVRTTYPNGADVEAGYKVLEVALPKLALQQIGAYFDLALYVDSNLLASLTYSAYEYLQGLSLQLDAEKAAIQAPLIEAEATAEQLAAAVAEQTKVQKLAATLVQFSSAAQKYAAKDVETEFSRLLSNYTPYHRQITNDKGFVTVYKIGFEALETPKAAAWIYTANANANLTGVGARFDSTLQLYVKFTAADLTGITVTYTPAGGEAQECLIVNVGGNDYVAYTQFTNLDNLTKDVTFTLSGDTNTQTCTYSFSAFVYSYQSITGEGTDQVKELAQTLKQFMDAVAQYVA